MAKQKENVEKNVKEMESLKGNALNEISLAFFFDMFHFSKSATFQILKKFEGYESWNELLATLADMNIFDFCPELKPKETKKESEVENG